jgi:agmatine deiminase
MKQRLIIVILTLVCLLLFLIAGNWLFRSPRQYRFPGEFEKQQAIWLQWPSEIYNIKDHPVNPVMISLIKALIPYIRVNLITQSANQIAEIQNRLKTKGFLNVNIYYYIVSHFSIWARDVGPIFIKDRRHRLGVVNFGFNNYSRDGNQDYIKIEGQVDKHVAGLLGLPVIDAKLISEGGAIESNGRGTMMVTESVALKRNPGLSKPQIEKEYKRVLGVTKVIWLKKGLAEDDNITSGHINEIARFASPNTILLAQVLTGDRNTNHFSRNSYLRLEENYRILCKATDQDGKRFRIIRIPMPPTLYQEVNITGVMPVRSYLNYILTNGALLMQTYWKPGRSEILKTTEQQVKESFKNIFPGRKIIGIDAENVNLWGGGLHCITQHMPAD